MNQQGTNSNFTSSEAAASIKQKRLRHLTCLQAKNLKINATRFNVWFTLHLNAECKAFFISEKKENDRSPKWNLKDSLSKYSFKKFLVRIWFSNLEDLGALKVTSSKFKPNQSALDLKQNVRAASRLNLLLEMDVNMDFLCELTDNNLATVTKSAKSYPNFLVFEVFAQNFSEPFVEVLKKRNNTVSVNKTQQPGSQNQKPTGKSTAKKSYTLNSMIRIHDFQRVIQESQLKIAQLQANSLNKFDQLGRLRQMQLKREEIAQRIKVYRDSLNELDKSINKLLHENSEIEERKKALSEKLENFDKNVYQPERKRYFQLEKICEFTGRSFNLKQSELKWRQKELIIELADIFDLESVIDAQKGQSELQASLPVNFRQPSKLKLINSSLVIGRGVLYPASNKSGSYAITNNNASIMTEVADDEENSISLGYLVHVSELLANILCVPLKYPVLFRSSRSYVIEQINDIDSRKLPLFKSSVSEDVFAYAVNLLNINLTQLKVSTDKRFLNIELASDNSGAGADLLLNLKSIFDYFKRLPK
jgi:hypothetical protein